MQRLIDIFDENQSMIARDDMMVKHIQEANDHIKMYNEKNFICDMPLKSCEPTIVSVSNLQSINAAEIVFDTVDDLDKVAVVDFANHKHIGGGCRSGKHGQEEDLCRTTTLYNHISSEKARRYYIDRSIDIMYVPNVYVTANLDKDSYVLDFIPHPFEISVIVTAAPLLLFRHMLPFGMQYKIHFNRAVRIMKVAYKDNRQGLITGAFGCGAFHNDPKAVSMAWNDAIRLYGGNFKCIEFAICEKPGSTELFDIFARNITVNKIAVNY